MCPEQKLDCIYFERRIFSERIRAIMMLTARFIPKHLESKTEHIIKREVHKYFMQIQQAKGFYSFLSFFFVFFVGDEEIVCSTQSIDIVAMLYINLCTYVCCRYRERQLQIIEQQTERETETEIDRQTEQNAIAAVKAEQQLAAAHTAFYIYVSTSSEPYVHNTFIHTQAKPSSYTQTYTHSQFCCTQTSSSSSFKEGEREKEIEREKERKM